MDLGPIYASIMKTIGGGEGNGTPLQYCCPENLNLLYDRICPVPASVDLELLARVRRMPKSAEKSALTLLLLLVYFIYYDLNWEDSLAKWYLLH